uniref:Uncharacterized protein n=1 Tax=Anguilla anguilla TaxID=7936 RepID=A0A0E9T762_ANGAN
MNIDATLPAACHASLKFSVIQIKLFMLHIFFCNWWPT